MQQVTIDYCAIDPLALRRACRPAWPRRLVVIGFAWLIFLLFLSPLIAWQLWEGRWLSLALLAGMFLVLAIYTIQNSYNQVLAALRRLPPLTLTLQPAGLEVYAPHYLHVLQGWPMYKRLLTMSRAAWLLNRDHGSSTGFLVPHLCFENAAAAEDFFRSVQTAIANQATCPRVADSNLIPVPTPRYQLGFQLTRSELYQDEALKERIKLFPETLSKEQTEAQQPARSWLLIGAIVAFVILLQFEEELLTLKNREFSFALPAFAAMIVVSLSLGQLPKILAWIRKRRRSPAPEVEVLLAEEGIFRRSEQERLAIPWSGVDTLQVHEGRLLLWRGSGCRLIIPLRAFDSSEQAHECERWIQNILQKQFNRLAVAELAEPEPVFDLPDNPPASNNPYQAPQ